MKIAVINFSGNVGKTTVARQLLLPRLKDAQMISIESINAGDDDTPSLRGRQFTQLLEQLLTVEHGIVDIGASNVEDLLDRMRFFQGSHTDFDYFVVPTVAPLKQQQDTIATLAELSLLGIPPQRIRVVFNNVDQHTELQETFGPLIAYLRQSSAAKFDPACRIGANELYERIRATNVSLLELANDDTDYKALIAKTSDAAERLALARRLAMRRLALGVESELDACFAALKLRPTPAVVA